MLRILPKLCGLTLLLAHAAGCILIPDVAYQPVVHNPFPQLSRVAVTPFFNHSDEETVNGRQFAMGYFAELQSVPGFEVVPLSVVEEAMIFHQIQLNQPGEARRLAQILGVDAVVIGAVTDYYPYYPPRCGLRVEWYAANPGFHEIPPGYGLPWGTPEEEYIPGPLVFEAEMALARAQLATQTPSCVSVALPLPPPPDAADSVEELPAAVTDPFEAGDASVKVASHEAQVKGDDVPLEPIPAPQPLTAASAASVTSAVGPPAQGALAAPPVMLPPNWPDERGFIPPGPLPHMPPCLPQYGPVMTHTRVFQGNDVEFTEALASYFHFKDEARFGGWQAFLERTDDFIRFCCHLHISEMLSARGGAGESRVVWRWSDSR
jgi:hypothetical protein